MAASALRFTACAGVLAAAVLMGGIGGGTAFADGADSTSSGADGTSTANDIDNNSGTAGGSQTGTDEKPTSTVGSGRDETAPEIEPGSSNKPNPSLSIPVVRWPTPAEVQETGVSAFITTVEIPLPDVEGFSALRQPDPAPTPAPSFRTLEEQAPVVDAGGEGSDALSATTGEPPSLQAPLVIAPPPVPGAPPLPVASVGASAGGQGPQAAAAGAKPALTQSSVARTEGTVSTKPAFTPLSGQATRVGFPRYFRNPTVRDLAMVALPGLGGLLLMTFSGGVLGYRQANSVRFIRTQGAERFLR